MHSPVRFGCLALLLVACKSHHGDNSERDTKGRSGAIITGGTTSVVDASITPVKPAYVRDPSVVETGVVTLTWPGTVKQSTGKAPPVGAACTLTTDFQVTNQYQPRNPHVVVACGAATLYDSAKSLNGTSHNSFTLGENPVQGRVSVFDYSLRASDMGPRAGDRNQYTVSTDDQELDVVRELAPTFRVTITLRGTPRREAKPVFDTRVPPFDQVVTAKATLSTSKGALPFTSKACIVTLSPGSSARNCRVQVTCGGKVVFGVGSYGYEMCTLQDGIPVSVTDTQPTPQDGDPELTVDMTAKTATLADELANGTSYSASFTLE